MRQLFANGYVAKPDRKQNHRVPLGETIYWLGREGAALVAGLQGATMRNFRWLRRPRYSMLSHDLAVNDFRITVAEALANEARFVFRILGGRGRISITAGQGHLH